jgi:hypothetical protein
VLEEEYQQLTSDLGRNHMPEASGGTLIETSILTELGFIPRTVGGSITAA